MRHTYICKWCFRDVSVQVGRYRFHITSCFCRESGVSFPNRVSFTIYNRDPGTSAKLERQRRFSAHVSVQRHRANIISHFAKVGGAGAPSAPPFPGHWFTMSLTRFRNFPALGAFRCALLHRNAVTSGVADALLNPTSVTEGHSVTTTTPSYQVLRQSPACIAFLR